jgi:subtilisin family serine protease
MGFQSGVAPAQQDAILAAVGVKNHKHLASGDIHILTVPPGHVTDVVNSLKAIPGVRYAEPDYIQYSDGGPQPDDPSLGVQWHIQNTGQEVNGISGTVGADVKAIPAWGVTTGTNSVVIAVLDTGTEYSHPDLVTNMWNNPGGIGGCAAGTHGFNVLLNSCDPLDDDVQYGGHGTHVSGIIGAIGNNSAGVAGVNWTTSIMALKWVQTGGNEDSGLSSDLVTAIDWVITAKKAGVNVRVVNDSASWPGTAFSQAVQDAIDALGTNGILFVSSAGNTGQNNDQIPRYPCSYDRPTMICVTASDSNDNLWTYSNFGATSVKLAAPGVNIYSTVRFGKYGFISGGSMASPMVAGTAALILSLGDQTVANLRSMILNNVDVIPSLNGQVATGGRLNICKAVPGCVSAVTAVPVNTALPSVIGMPQYGSFLSASTGKCRVFP